MEQERRYDLHCQEEYERLSLNRIALGEFYPSDYRYPARSARNSR